MRSCRTAWCSKCAAANSSRESGSASRGQRGNAQHGLALRDLLAAPDKAPEGYSRSMRDELQKRVREHEERAAFLTFVAGHLQPQTVYRLRSSDLRMMEIMPNHVHWF